MQQRIIMGIDPGTQIMGYGILAISAQNKMQCNALGVIKFPTKKGVDNIHKLGDIYKSVQQLIEKHKPTELAIEAPFYGKNVQSMLKLGRAQGVVISACIAHGISVAEYMPKKIKQSVSGNGNTTKEQVLALLEKILSIKIDAKYLDASDALACALCHFFQNTQ